MSVNPSRSLLIVMSTLLAAGCVTQAEIESLTAKEFEKIKRQMPQTSSAAEYAYVYCVSRAIIAQLESPYDTMDWEVVVFDNETVNAFAGAGGKIGVNNGILAVAKNQDELAAVIGHEVAHVTELHALEDAARQIGIGNAVNLSSAALGGTRGDMLIIFAELGFFRPYSRSQEAEADVVGLDYMAGAGFDPRASVQLWKNMDAAVGGDLPPQFLSTHPSPENRIDDLIGQLRTALPLYNEAVAAGRRPNCRNPNS